MIRETRIDWMDNVLGLVASISQISWGNDNWALVAIVRCTSAHNLLWS